jgi:hypothetical protein
MNLQVCCQPSFAAVEAGLQSSRCCSGSSSQNDSPAACSKRAGNTRRDGFASLAFRCAYVAFTTLVAAALPFFAVILGLVAALTFYQTAVLYPVLLHRAVYPRKRAGVLLTNAVLFVAATVIALVVIGSVAVIAMSATKLSPFKAQ